MKYEQKYDCLSWQFSELPAFTAGKMSPLFADCGSGLSTRPDSETADHSFMHSFSGASSEDVKLYADKLAAGGYEKLAETNRDGNLFLLFSVPEGQLSVTHSNKTSLTRIILDRCRTEAPASFGYGTYEALRGDTVFAQYSLHYGSMIRGTTCDCGMNYVYRLRDNSLIIIDGGEFEQATDAAVDDYMGLLRELTGQTPGEKLRVSLWICTHAHNDHCDFFSKLLRFHADELTVERAAFNFPDSRNVRHSDSVLTVKQRLTEKYPDIRYIKPHAGCAFSIADAEIEYLISAEDTVGHDPDDPFCGTNDTSMLFTITAGGIKTLFLADCGDENGDMLIRMYGRETLACDLLQAAHHGINEIFPVYDRITAGKVLLPQCPMNMDTRFGGVYNNLCRLYGKENILFASEATDVFTLSDGRYTIKKRKHIGTEYDGSEW